MFTFSWEPFTHAPVEEGVLSQNEEFIDLRPPLSHEIFYSFLPPVLSVYTSEKP